ncbi:hypothetical protein WDV85_05505 [Pseudokineococcus sp. 5B2Z-1]|uniref:hypothetical protein n=1 Tax=Pseudokineococcus sp. 5B2Z-1 TaxID=3132744 RepID=UPI0030B07A22
MMTTSHQVRAVPRERVRARRAAAAAAATALALTTASPLAASAAAPRDGARTLYAAPDGVDRGLCRDSARPCSLLRAKSVASREAIAARDVTVVLADGVYRLDAPLEFGRRDGGRRGATTTWEAAPGATPEITGARQVTGWRVDDADAGVYVADLPVGLDTRQLYVDGRAEPRASLPLDPSDLELTPEGLHLLDPDLSYLGDLPDRQRLEFLSLGDFTTRYSPVADVVGDRVDMEQPTWDNQTWGYDTVQQSFLAAPTWSLENARAFVDEPGEWSVDPDAGELYYKPADGVDPDGLDVEVPTLESLVSISGTYDAPVTGLTFRGLRFTGTSWLEPSRSGYANQQNGTFLSGEYDYRPEDAFTSCARGCEAFERARNTWKQEPAAVQVSAARRITFEGSTFTELGQSALGIGNDANATRSGVGLGARDVDVLANVFTEVGGHGIVVGGVRPDAHHPSDVRMTNRDVVLRDNTVRRVATEYRDNSGILSTYVTGAQILHNEVADVSYDGIDTGFGWGSNDPGGSDEYLRRGYYDWNTLYTTPTTLRDNLVAGNLVHDTKAAFADGGSVYNLSASPGSVFERNYLYDVSGVALYLDEGTRYTTWRQNVLEGTSPWVFTNAYSAGNGTADNLLESNWYTSGGAQVPNAEERNNRLVDNRLVDPEQYPPGAVDVICEAGVSPDVRTDLNADVDAFPVCASADGED